MAIPNRFAIFVLRVGLCVLGAGTFAWSTFAEYWAVRSNSIVAVGQSILESGSYHETDLSKIARLSVGSLPPQAMFYLGVISIEVLASHLKDPSIGSIDPALQNSEQSVLRALATMPGNSFLWLQLLSIKISREGFSVDRLALLRMSYQTGPREMWIAARRNRLSLSVFSSMDAQLQNAAVAEFAALVDGYAYSIVVPILVEAPPELRSRLASGLEAASLYSREGLYSRLAQAGIHLSIPGVIEPEARPWR